MKMTHKYYSSFRRVFSLFLILQQEYRVTFLNTPTTNRSEICTYERAHQILSPRMRLPFSQWENFFFENSMKLQFRNDVDTHVMKIGTLLTRNRDFLEIVRYNRL